MSELICDRSCTRCSESSRCGAVHVERVLGGLLEGEERRGERLQERALPDAEARLRQARGEHPRAEADAGEPLVEEGAGPLRQARVDRALEREDALGHAAGRRDDDDHDHLRLEQQHLDVADRRRVDRRRGDDRQEVRDLAERLGRHAHRLVDLAACQLEAEPPLRRRRRREQLVDVEAVPGVRRDAPRAGVRVGEQPVLLEHRQLVADRRRAALQLGIGRKRLRPHGLAGRGIRLDDLAQDELLAGAQHSTECRQPRAATAGSPPRRCG